MSIIAGQQLGQQRAEEMLSAIIGLQARVATRLTALVARLRTDANGRILRGAANIATMQAIIAEAKATMIDDEFLEALAKYLEGFDEILDEVAEDYDVDEDPLRELSRAFKGSIAEALVNPDTYTSSLWRPIANTMLLGIATNAILGDVAGAVGEQVGAGAVLQSVEADVASAPSTLGRTLTQNVADQIGAEFFRYQGRPIKTTRVFCAEREGKVWHREEIADWGRRAAAGEDLDGNGNPGWAGMVEGTNEQTIFVFLGGWYGGRQNCRHVLVPLARRDVPAEDLARMREKGLVE
jgi:hypothetical protein